MKLLWILSCLRACTLVAWYSAVPEENCTILPPALAILTEFSGHAWLRSFASPTSPGGVLCRILSKIGMPIVLLVALSSHNSFPRGRVIGMQIASWCQQAMQRCWKWWVHYSLQFWWLYCEQFWSYRGGPLNTPPGSRELKKSPVWIGLMWLLYRDPLAISEGAFPPCGTYHVKCLHERKRGTSPLLLPLYDNKIGRNISLPSSLSCCFTPVDGGCALTFADP